MSIEKQYYTPTLSEFHPNFRYEYLLGSHLDKNIPNNEREWGQYNFAKDSPQIFDIEGWRMNLEDCIKDGFVRVKSLDNSDIIEAGWKESTTSFSEGRQYYQLGKYECFYEDGELFIRPEHAEDGYYMFQGTVKNYNKLLDVMEMLGIDANS